MTAPRLYIIIVGGGKVGFHLAKELVESNYEVLVIELEGASGLGPLLGADRPLKAQDVVLRPPRADQPGSVSGRLHPGADCGPFQARVKEFRETALGSRVGHTQPSVPNGIHDARRTPPGGRRRLSESPTLARRG